MKPLLLTDSAGQATLVDGEALVVALSGSWAGQPNCSSQIFLSTSPAIFVQEHVKKIAEMLR